MIRLRSILLSLGAAGVSFAGNAQEQSTWEITDLSGEGGVLYQLNTGTTIATNGVLVRYEDGVLTAQRVVVNQNTGEVMAQGNVRIQRQDQVWVSEEAVYNFKTRKFEAQEFRTGAYPIFAAGQGLQAEPRRPRLLRMFQTHAAEPGAPSVIGASIERIRSRDKEAAAQAIRFPAGETASPPEAATSKTADLNADGFVTTDEVLALKQLGLSDADVLERLAATEYVFEVTSEQQSLLWSYGLDRAVVDQIPTLGDGAREQFESKSSRQSQVPDVAQNYAYTGTNAIVTADDISDPFLKIRAKHVRIIPGQRIEAKNAVLYLGDVPVFYFPYYSRNLNKFANHFSFVPGYRSSYGPFLLTSYNWFYNEQLWGSLHADYRVKRGFGGGPDINYDFGKYGAGEVMYYYLHDQDPRGDVRGADNPEDRQRVYFSYLSEPATNLTVRSMVRYQGDTNIVREFFEGEYRRNPQPSTFVEVNKFWRNFSLDFYAQPRVNDFLETVERLPDVRLTGFRQQIGELPLYYDSESSVGYYRRLFAETNSEPMGLNYSAARADTYHQITHQETLFGWLRIMPRVGGRFTYYSEASGPGGVTDDQTRGVFNTGAEVSFKASRVMPEFQSKLLDADGLRHIVEPSINYVFVPEPSVQPRQLPQFDTELPSFRLLPIEFPDYNAIDSIDSQNVTRLGLRNKFQTKRGGDVATLAYWDLYTDLRLDPRHDQTRFADLYSDLVLRPRSWITLESITRYDVETGKWRMSYHTMTLQPNDVWSWGVGHFYLRDDFRNVPTALGEGNDSLLSTLFYRVNENWGFRAHHRFDIADGKMQEQAYTVYRDLRSWTAALTLRLRDNPLGANDFTVAFTFSLKAFPRYGLGSDSLRQYTLWGY